MSRAIGKIIEIDGPAYEYTGVIWINGWIVITNNDAASVTIEDVNNIPVIRGVSALSSERMIRGPSLASPQRIENLKGITWINIERVLIFIDRFGPD